MSDRDSLVSEQAARCFAHGLGHLLSELGESEGIRRAIRTLVSMEDSELRALPVPSPWREFPSEREALQVLVRPVG